MTLKLTGEHYIMKKKSISILKNNRITIKTHFPSVQYILVLRVAGWVGNEPIEELTDKHWFLQQGTVKTHLNANTGVKDFSFKGDQKHIKAVIRFFRNNNNWLVFHSSIVIAKD